MADFCIAKNNTRLIETLLNMGCSYDLLEKSDKSNLAFFNLPLSEGDVNEKNIRHALALVAQSRQED